MVNLKYDNSELGYSIKYATVAKSDGVEMLYFSPKAINIKRKILMIIITRKCMDKNCSPFEDVIYNTGSPIK